MKNTLQVVSSLLQMHSREYDAIPQPMVQGVVAHIRSFSVVYDLIGEGAKRDDFSQCLSLSELLKRITEILDTGRQNRFLLETVNATITPRSASSTSLIVTELLFHCRRFGKGETEIRLGWLEAPSARLTRRCARWGSRPRRSAGS